MPGMPGVPGSQGPQGRDGTKGQIGDKGSQGMPGRRGDRGREGPPGKSGPRGIMGVKGQQGLVGIKGERGIVGSEGRKGDKGEKGASVKASQPSVVPQTNWKQCVWKSQSGTDNGKIKVIRIRIIHNTLQRKFIRSFFFLIRIFQRRTSPLSLCQHIKLHKLLFSYISLSFGSLGKKKRKTIVRDKMIPGHMDKANKN